MAVMMVKARAIQKLLGVANSLARALGVEAVERVDAESILIMASSALRDGREGGRRRKAKRTAFTPLLAKHRAMPTATRSLRCFRARTTSRMPRVRSRYIADLLEVMSGLLTGNGLPRAQREVRRLSAKH